MPLLRMTGSVFDRRATRLPEPFGGTSDRVTRTFEGGVPAGMSKVTVYGPNGRFDSRRNGRGAVPPVTFCTWLPSGPTIELKTGAAPVNVILYDSVAPPDAGSEKRYWPLPSG